MTHLIILPPEGYGWRKCFLKTADKLAAKSCWKQLGSARSPKTATDKRLWGLVLPSVCVKEPWRTPSWRKVWCVCVCMYTCSLWRVCRGQRRMVVPVLSWHGAHSRGWVPQPALPLPTEPSQWPTLPALGCDLTTWLSEVGMILFMISFCIIFSHFQSKYILSSASNWKVILVNIPDEVTGFTY